jgi:hypothetical protein
MNRLAANSRNRTSYEVGHTGKQGATLPEVGPSVSSGLISFIRINARTIRYDLDAIERALENQMHRT